MVGMRGDPEANKKRCSVNYKVEGHSKSSFLYTGSSYTWGPYTIIPYIRRCGTKVFSPLHIWKDGLGTHMHAYVGINKQMHAYTWHISRHVGIYPYLAYALPVALVR